MLISPIKRVTFDPELQPHRMAVHEFMETGKWTIYFKLQEPWYTLPEMCISKLLKFYKTEYLPS